MAQESAAPAQTMGPSLGTFYNTPKKTHLWTVHNESQAWPSQSDSSLCKLSEILMGLSKEKHQLKNQYHRLLLQMPNLRMLGSCQTDGWNWGHRNKLLSLAEWYYPGYFCLQHTKSALVPKICISQATKHFPGEDDSCTILICNWKSFFKKEEKKKKRKPFSLLVCASPLTPYNMKDSN